MLLGSFVEEYDQEDDDEDETAAPVSPDHRIGAGEALQRTSGPTRALTGASAGASTSQPLFAEQIRQSPSPSA